MIVFLFSMQILNTKNNTKITQDINIFKYSFYTEGKIIGFDNGKKTLGIAISDIHKRIALTHKTIFKSKLSNDLEILDNIITENKIISIVLGFPLNKDGTKGRSAQSAITFARILEQSFKLPILLWDERFSSIGIEREMIKAGIKKNKIKVNIDAASATWILQSTLDAINKNMEEYV